MQWRTKVEAFSAETGELLPKKVTTDKLYVIVQKKTKYNIIHENLTEKNIQYVVRKSEQQTIW